MVKDKYELNGFNQVKLPKLKGHIKLTLHNVHNGKNEVYEGENIVTNAIRDIMANNYLGAVNYSTLFPLWSNWYGGVLLYQNAHPTIEVGGEQVLDPDNYYPKSQIDNPLTAHAGGTSIPAEHDDDLKRGSPTVAAFQPTPNSIKQVWEWSTTHGNGAISAISLTHKDTGDAGLGSNTWAFQNFNPFVQVQNLADYVYDMQYHTVAAQYDDANELWFAIGNDLEWADARTGGHSGSGRQVFSTDVVTIYIRKFPFFKAGLYQTLVPDVTYQKAITLTMPFTLYAMPCYYFDYANKKLWLFTNLTGANQAFSKTTIKWIRIDLSDLEDVSVEANGTITSDTSNLAPLGYGDNTDNYSRGRSVFSAILFDGTYFYFPTGNAEAFTGYQKINFSDQSDQSTIVFNTTSYNTVSPAYCGGLTVGINRVTNGLTGYTCANSLPMPPEVYTWLNAQPNKPICFYNWVDPYRTTSQRVIVANKMLNTTLFNLPNSVQKSASQAMTVEYTLTEVE